MINHSSTNILYLSDLLPKKFPDFYKTFTSLLDQYKIEHKLIEGTKDIWARDYMPIQIFDYNFTQFKYDPSYLNTASLKKTKTNTNSFGKQLLIKVNNSSINLDGGNVIAQGNKAILCDRVIKENPGIPLKELIEELRWGLRVNNIIFIPTMEDDLFGHADGIVRFINNKNVLINDFADSDMEFGKLLESVLKKAGLNTYKFPYNPYSNKSKIDATGVYINFLQMKNIIFFPVFKMIDDKLAEDCLKMHFPKSKLVPVPCQDLAKEGGLLNCISWNIVKPERPYDDLEKEIERDLLCLGLD